MTTPTVLSFDLDDTLWPVAPVIAEAEQGLYRWLQQRHPQVVAGHDIESLRTIRAAVAVRYPDKAHDLTWLRHRALQDLFAGAGHAPLHADAALEVFLEHRNKVRFYDDVQPALERLSRRYRLFALSNGNADLTRCGIGKFFAGHVSARHAGAAKPDARIFLHLLGAAGVRADEVLHVGDDPLADVVGASQAGIRAVWLNRDARAWPAHHSSPRRTIASLSELE